MDILDRLPQRIASLRVGRRIFEEPAAMQEKKSRASAWLDSVESILSRPLEELLEDDQGWDWDLASFRLFLATQECIDLLAHWIAGEDWCPPNDPASAFGLLADHAVIDQDLAIRLRKVVELRDRISHGDFKDRAHLQGEYREGVVSLRRFLVAVAEKAGI
ncbi:MAG TPA: HepT-like ribonuclease domain-containing protein [Thermoanaerobaculia bacterium]|jgi:uncharacterized protein YutE (UPF0331/DUF86 family)